MKLFCGIRNYLKNGEIMVALRLSGCTYMNKSDLYISSRNIFGIGRIDLDRDIQQVKNILC